MPIIDFFSGGRRYLIEKYCHMAKGFLFVSFLFLMLKMWIVVGKFTLQTSSAGPENIQDFVFVPANDLAVLDN